MSLNPATSDASIIQSLFNATTILAALVFILVEGLLLYVALRYFRRKADEMPVQVHGSNKAELTWTIIPFLIVAGLGIVSVGTMDQLTARGTSTNPVAHVHALNDELARKSVEEAKKTDLVIDIKGRQWFWQYTYQQYLTKTLGVRASSQSENPAANPQGEFLIVPEGKTVRLDMDSADVIHAWWVPQLGGMIYVNPGDRSYVWFNAKAGEYYGQCNFYCGTNHAQMISRVRVVPQAEFDAYIKGKRAEQQSDIAARENRGGDAKIGEQLYAEGAYRVAASIGAAKGDVAAAATVTGMEPQAVAHVMAYLESIK
jgi:cytochrome c oxidase subunit 2